jgi:tight adherence protein B
MLVSEQVQLLGVLAGLAVISVALGLGLRTERAQMELRLATFLGGWRPATAATGAGAARRPPPPDLRHPLLRRARLGAPAHLLAQAGLSLSPTSYLLIQLTAGLVGLGLARLIAIRLQLEGLPHLALLAQGLGIGLAVVRLALALLRKRRLQRFERQFPLALDNISNAIQAGLSLPQALELVARDLPSPVGTELGTVVREMGMGLSIEEALDHLEDRVPLSDVEIFVAAVHIQYRTGGNLSDILRSIAHTVRERLRIRAEIRVLTAQQRISAYIVSALPLMIALALKFLSPSYFEKLMQPGTMRGLVLMAALGMVCGFYTMMRIADIEV